MQPRRLPATKQKKAKGAQQRPNKICRKPIPTTKHRELFPVDSAEWIGLETPQRTLSQPQGRLFSISRFGSLADPLLLTRYVRLAQNHHTMSSTVIQRSFTRFRTSVWFIRRAAGLSCCWVATKRLFKIKFVCGKRWALVQYQQLPKRRLARGSGGDTKLPASM